MGQDHVRSKVWRHWPWMALGLVLISVPVTYGLKSLAPEGVKSEAFLKAPQALQKKPQPVIFVHGNGDHSGVWQNTIWLFESNGYPREQLYAFDLKNPNATDSWDTPQDYRSTPEEAAAQLSLQVKRIRDADTGEKVILVGNSRGALTIRNFIKTYHAESAVEAVILGGGVNHGVGSIPFGPKTEFNGAGAFLQRLNASPEVPSGVRFVTIRSDRNDKYAQPDGVGFGIPFLPIGSGYTGPALKGATDVVLPGADHHEVATSPEAFAIIYKTVTGKPPKTLSITQEAVVELDGMVSGAFKAIPTNQPEIGARVRIFAFDPERGQRLGEPRLDKEVGADGHFGPFMAEPKTFYEFEVTRPNKPTYHFYRAPFSRSFDHVGLRLMGLTDNESKIVAQAKQKGGVIVQRPRAYFDLRRDTITVNGQVPQGIRPNMALDFQGLSVDHPVGEKVLVQFDGRRYKVPASDLSKGDISVVEFHN